MECLILENRLSFSYIVRTFHPQNNFTYPLYYVKYLFCGWELGATIRTIAFSPAPVLEFARVCAIGRHVGGRGKDTQTKVVAVAFIGKHSETIPEIPLGRSVTDDDNCIV